MKKVFFIAISLMIYGSSFAQKSGGISKKKIYYGIAFGVRQSFLDFGDYSATDYNVTGGNGWNLAIFSEVRISKYISISPQFGFTFSESNLKRKGSIGKAYTYRLVPMSLDFVTHLVFRTGQARLSPYFLVGPNYQKVFKIGDKEHEIWSDKSNFSIDMGLGMDFSFKHFILSPELRYSYGLTDVDSLDIIGLIKKNTLALVFVFKG